jgi:small-conductance mechanosensitive channel
MTTWLSSVLPPWAARGVESVAIIAAAYLVAWVIARVVGRRLSALAGRTSGKWDDAVVGELSRRVPFWGLLVGVYLAAGLLPMPGHLIATLNKLLFVVAVLSVTFSAARVAVQLTRDYSQHVQSDLALTSLSQAVARGLVVVLGLLIILNGLGVSITPMLTALGVGGLAVALALQDTLANLFAGFYVTLARQVRVGDYVRLESGQDGQLVDITWRTTRIRTPADNVILVPNSRFAQAIVTNYHLPEKDLAVSFNLGIDYDSDLAHVERVTVEVAREVLRATAGAVEAFDPVVRFHTFADSRIEFTVTLRARTFGDQSLVKHEFVKQLHDRYRREGIRIPFPVRTIVMNDGETGPVRRSAA